MAKRPNPNDPLAAAAARRLDAPEPVTQLPAPDEWADRVFSPAPPKDLVEALDRMYAAQARQRKAANAFINTLLLHERLEHELGTFVGGRLALFLESEDPKTKKPYTMAAANRDVET